MTLVPISSATCWWDKPRRSLAHVMMSPVIRAGLFGVLDFSFFATITASDATWPKRRTAECTSSSDLMSAWQAGPYPPAVSLSIRSIICRAQRIALAMRDTVRGVWRDSWSSSVSFMRLATRMDAAIKSTRLRPSSMSTPYHIRLLFASENWLGLCSSSDRATKIHHLIFPRCIIMSAAQAIPLDPRPVPEKQKRTNARATVASVSLTLSGIADLPAAATNVGKAVGVIQNGVATGATELAAVASNHGYNGLATVCLKVAAAAPVIAKVIVCLALVAVAFCIFRWLRSDR